jgi:hypothetical protein
MNSKQRTYGILGVDYQDEGFRAIGVREADVNPYLAILDMQTMFAQASVASKVLSASKLRQSTPEELVEALNGRAITSKPVDEDGEGEIAMGLLPYPNINAFKREVINIEGGKELRAFTFDKESNRIEVYAWRILGGEFGDTTGSTLVNLLSAEEGYAYDRYITKSNLKGVLRNGTVISLMSQEEQDREWAQHKNYVPTSHLERITIGGTALFAPDLVEEAESYAEKVVMENVETEEEIRLTCEWYPDGDTLCGAPTTHARTPQLAGVCDDCFGLREARDTQETVA